MRETILRSFQGCAKKVRDVIMPSEIDMGKKVGTGADGTPIKKIDQMAENTAVEFLMETHDFSILSEEAGFIEGDSEGTVIMDPIDGTSNAVLGIPFYAVSLAYTPTDLRGVEVGYVMNLPVGTEFYAVKGRNRSFAPKKNSMNFSVYMGKEAHPDCFKVAALPRRTRSLGSAALEMSMVASGALDLYYMKTVDMRRSLRITDIAASTLILREAGGEVYGGDHEPLNMPLDPKVRRDVIAVRDPGLMEALP
ncbi:MAG: inositol monophosphatase family protein [Thermoplasmata archaeon]